MAVRGPHSARAVVVVGPVLLQRLGLEGHAVLAGLQRTDQVLGHLVVSTRHVGGGEPTSSHSMGEQRRHDHQPAEAAARAAAARASGAA